MPKAYPTPDKHAAYQAYLPHVVPGVRRAMAIPPKPDPRVIVPIPPRLIKEIDDYRWANRIPSRAAAIRELIKRGLKANNKPR